jgi:3-methyladenine DNA glycosylase AlkC
MEPFKNLLSPAVVRAAGLALSRSSSAFDGGGFERLALGNLEALEMKARAMHIADALEVTLPSTFTQACDAIEAALGPPVAVDGVASNPTQPEQGLAGWIVWPLGEYVARRGLSEPERALQALHALTQRLTAEFAIRPFLVSHPKLTFKTLQRWTCDDSAHVRRLCSEGSRPRLPWGLRLQALVADPSPTLPILQALQDDPSAYVRRSVANHLNDIAKDHPQVVVDWVAKHLPHASDERRALLSHASRTLIKQGHAGLLTLWGAGLALKGNATLQASPRKVPHGGSIELELTLQSTSSSAQKLLVDYAVHHVKADGSTRPKVFKGWKLTLGANEQRVLTKTHSFKPITTRQYHPGRHGLDVRINGRVVAQTSIELMDHGR